jgi:hypothetical protein
MKKPRFKLLLWLGLGASVLGVSYCTLGLIQLASYSAGPNFPKDLALFRMKLWLFLMLLCAGIATVFGIKLWRMNR